MQAFGHVLNTVDISQGVAQCYGGGRRVSDTTQWVAIKDLTQPASEIGQRQTRGSGGRTRAVKQ